MIDDSVHIEVTLPWLLAWIAERLLPPMKRKLHFLLERNNVLTFADRAVAASGPNGYCDRAFRTWP